MGALTLDRLNFRRFVVGSSLSLSLSFYVIFIFIWFALISTTHWNVLNLWLHVYKHNIRHASNAPNWIQNNHIYYIVFVSLKWINNDQIDGIAINVLYFVFSSSLRRLPKIIETNNSICISMEKHPKFCILFVSR